mgnify:CR=1 FL=1|jgi:hypothetical protein
MRLSNPASHLAWAVILCLFTPTILATDIDDIQSAIFTPSCAVSGCHNGSIAPNLSAGMAYARIVDVASGNFGLDYIEPGDPDDSYLVRKVDTGTISGGKMPPGAASLSQANIALLRDWVTDGAVEDDSAVAKVYDLPFMPRGDDAEHQGFMRVVNLSASSADVSVSGLTDSGMESAGASTFSVPGNGAMQFQVSHLETGDISKGLTGSIGASGVNDGDWRLRFQSTSPLKVLGYYRSPETGFITPLHDTSYPAFSGTQHQLFTANPGSNLNQLAKLRFINNSKSSIVVDVSGYGDDGTLSDTVNVTLPALQVVTATMAELEDGSSNSLIVGSMGDGQGKWRITTNTSDNQPYSLMSLIFAPDGYLSNMTPEGYDVTSNGGRFPITCASLDGATIFGDSSANVYLGFLGSASGVDSVYNSSGDYGDASSDTSINNTASTWGSSSSEFSANNSTADTPPLIIKAGRVLGRLTTNSDHQDAIVPSFTDSCSFSALTGKTWTNPKDETQEPSEVL